MQSIESDISPAAQSMKDFFASLPAEPYVVRAARERAAREGQGEKKPGDALDATHKTGTPHDPPVASDLPKEWHAHPSKQSQEQLGEDEDDDGGVDEEDTCAVPPVPRKPSARALREALAEQGDVAGVYDAILRNRWDSSEYGDAFRDLLTAIDVAGRRNPSQCSGEIFRLLLNFSACCTLRVQIALLQRIECDDRQGRSFDLLTNHLEEYQKHLVSMQLHVADLCQRQAATARLWELGSRRKRAGCQPSASNGGKNSGRSTLKRAPNGRIRSNGEAARAAKNGQHVDRLATSNSAGKPDGKKNES